MFKCPQLPNSVQEIADIIGEELALILVRALPRSYASGRNPSGRRVIYVPKVMRHDHPLASIVGYEAACQLSDYVGGDFLRLADVGSWERNKAVLAMRAAGKSTATIAGHFGLSPQHVRNIVRDHSPANDNPVNAASKQFNA